MATARHPYDGIAPYQRWSRGVTWAPPGALDPVVRSSLRVGPDDRIATIGSCFAQHLSRHLERSGLHYYVAEQAPAGMDDDEARRRQYGTFSARYGNVYTVAQALQLLRRAYGELDPIEDVWRRGDAVVDPFRPLVEPEGFADEAAMRADRELHLAAVRTMVEQADVLVFTLGLTEAWRHREDGVVFAAAPGVNGGIWDPQRHEFVNFGIDEVRSGLVELCDRLHEINPGLHVLLTISPVPLIATYEDRHVLVSTTVSKAVLRVAADEAVARRPSVHYFPSYEIIAPATGVRSYYAPDRREVEDLGVQHVMRCFTRHVVDGRPWGEAAGDPPPIATLRQDAEAAVVCDEETVEAAIEATGGAPRR